MSQFCLCTNVVLILCLCWISDNVLSQDSSSRVAVSNEDSLYFFYQRPEYPRDCTEARICSTDSPSGVHLIKPDGYRDPFEVYCDNTLDSGRWTVIQRLQDGSILFNRNWTEYKTGFGFLSQEFWIGNDKLSFLTNQNTYELRIDFTSADDQSFFVTYSKFRISDEYGEYKLTSVGEYSGSEDNITRFLCPPNSEGAVYITPDCSRRCFCSSGQFTCDDAYHCDPNAVCEERNNVLQCYCNEGYVGDGVNCTINTPPSDCKDIYDRVSTASGVYTIKPTTWQGDPFEVYCNMSDGGGWTVFQRRVDGSQDFFLYWSDYKVGFGTPDHELWLGNDKLHSLTSQGNNQLRIDFVNKLGNPYYATYSSFSISDESDKYRLSVGGYSGTSGDYLISYHNGQAFTTRDRDNDLYSVNCATYSYWYCDGTYYPVNGAWWYNNCGYTSLNSPYNSGSFYWYPLPGGYCFIKFTEMKVRRV
ncbi:Fibrinogen-like protein A [Holothuria leucospilota]|uniref:Fibrinogen-like protein A n=1 Tax=Holothuria leucospilota TaxID=206669 RepID=A0A9Q1BVC8_HOLLE|nr:Fibrinogen-like protein A [Holothuria leucospilota]